MHHQNAILIRTLYTHIRTRTVTYIPVRETTLKLSHYSIIGKGSLCAKVETRVGSYLPACFRVSPVKIILNCVPRVIPCRVPARILSS
jgi:hypothetical protein